MLTGFVSSISCGLTSLNRFLTLLPNRRSLDLIEGSMGTQSLSEEISIWGMLNVLGLHYSFDVSAMRNKWLRSQSVVELLTIITCSIK